ncbi:hypothetical protein MYAM1_003186 [Malassezia yamatoensis]|uniref:PUM-HD domain-containing protein n=1 Tax=Malassezia yamatoensis TaxID=253288 RepID=A0AAJ6CK80_9BASI|nr:hypothetical protein MYAM1_003186 [Malassezia yamatoensis]
MSEPGSSPWTRSVLADALGPTDTFTESPPTTWPSAATKYEEWSSTETRIEQLERRVTALERQLGTTSIAQPMFCDEAITFAEPKHRSAHKRIDAAMPVKAFKQIASGMPAGTSRSTGAPRPMTPDEFNPFFDVDTTNWSMYGVDAFPEAVVYHPRKPEADHRAEAYRAWPKPRSSQTSEDFKDQIFAANRTQSEAQLGNRCVLQWATEQIRQVLEYSEPGPCIALQQQLKFTEKAHWIIQAISQSIYSLSLHELGRFIVYRALGYDASLARRLIGSFSKLATCSNGTMVLLRILQLKEMRTDVLNEMLRAPIVPRIMNAAALPIWRDILHTKWPDPSRVGIMHTLQMQLQSQWTHVAMNDVGSVVIQECFQAKLLKENSSGVAELVVHCIECLCDQYGVWVIQCLVEHGDEFLRRQITRQILKHAAAVCLSPYGAKAVQAILRFSTEHVLVELIDKLCEPRWHFRHASRPLLIDVALTQQGLPLIAQLLITTDQRRAHILQLVQKYAVLLKSNKSGHRVIQMCGRC